MIATHYQMVKHFYADQTAKRSKIPLINHIDEGMKLLEYFNADDYTIAAYAVHPLVQDNEIRQKQIDNGIVATIDPTVLKLAYDYSTIANDYLCRNNTDNYDYRTIMNIIAGHINHGCDSRALIMLKADKAQNRKDFEIAHLGTHPRSDQLHEYFKKWLNVLGISEYEYTNILIPIMTK